MYISKSFIIPYFIKYTLSINFNVNVIPYFVINKFFVCVIFPADFFEFAIAI